MFYIIEGTAYRFLKKHEKMGIAKTAWNVAQDAGKWIGNKIEEFAGWAGKTLNKFNEPERQAALEDQEHLMETQLGLNKEAAEHGHQLQKDMIDYTSPSMQIERLKDAGLNPALIYGAGGGVSGQSVGNQSTSGVSGHSSDAGARMMAKNQQLAMGLQLAKLRSEIDVNKSVAEVNKASAGKQTSETQTIDKTRDLITENIRQEGIQKWLENVLKDYKISGQNQGNMRNAALNWYTSIDENAPEMKAFNSAILKTIAEELNISAQADYNEQKAENFLKELYIAQQHGNAAEEQAAAAKLIAEFNTGTEINWKNISDVAIRILQALIGLKPKGGGITINK